MKRVRPQTNVEPGEFPYPLTDGPDESRYLMWIRNHSNYMAERGFLDYFRLVGVLVRGMLVNFVTLLPYLLVVSLLLNFLYGSLLRDWEDQAEAGKDDSPIEWFVAKAATDSGWVKSVQDRVYGTTLAVAGDWSAGDTLTTTLTETDGSPMSVDTEVRPEATTVEEVRDRHKDDLEAGTGLFDEIAWSTSGIEKIVADVDEKPIRISTAATSASGAFHLSAPTPFLFTPIVLLLAGGWVLIFPIVSRLSKVVGHKKTLEMGTTSSHRIRDLFERSYGVALLAILAVVLIESLPLLVHYFHQIREVGLRWLTFPTLAGVVGMLVAANKLLPLLGGMMRKLAMVLVGTLGLLVPLLVILFVAEFLVYAAPYEGGRTIALFLVPILMALGIIVTFGVGIGSLKWEGVRNLLLLLVGVLGLAVAIFFSWGIFKTVLPGYLNLFIVLAFTVEIWLFSWLTVDVNLTSINGLYRDRLASAFLVGADTKGDVEIEEDVDLQEISRHEAGSTAPYHLVNVAHNLQGSKDIALRERNSDFFIFSKRFIGGDRTGYCPSEHMEQVFPQIDLGTAMAISAAAASPNMGRNTNPLMVAFLTLLNIRLGYWIPHPGRLEKLISGERKRFEEDVFPVELEEIERRREQAYQSKTTRRLADDQKPTTDHGLVGIGFSGGGIRSATINLGIAQKLHERGVFDHIDYMSTVSGGGYLGSSISTLMRYKTKPISEVNGTVSLPASGTGEKIVRVTRTKEESCDYPYANDAELAVADGERIEAGQRLINQRGARIDSEINGTVSLAKNDKGEKIVRVTDKEREYRYTKDAELAVEAGEIIEAGERVLKRRTGSAEAKHSTLWSRFRWRVPPRALMSEMLSKVDEDHKWVNLSDGGHIENLAAIELLRRRCKFIIIGDGEADPNLWFNGLAALVRYARIDLGIDISIDLDAIRVDKCQDAVDKGTDNLSRAHWAVGTITYPEDEKNGYKKETGHLLYLKSSFSGDEDEVIEEYRHRNPAFPHESTADQFFDEGQFEAYRALGEHIAKKALEHVPVDPDEKIKIMLEKWFDALGDEQARTLKEMEDERVTSRSVEDVD